MRSKSALVGGFQVFAVAGTNTVSFGISASAAARVGLLGFAVQRIDSPGGTPHYLLGYKEFPSTKSKDAADHGVSTKSQPVQALVWDDTGCDPGHTYSYVFEPLRGTPAKLDRSATPIPLAIATEPLYGQTHDVFFNRGVASSQAYALEFGDVAPDKQTTAAKQAAAYAWLTRDLEPALVKFIVSAKKGDQLRCAFYEFAYAPVLAAFKAALARGVDVKIIVDEKANSAKDPLSENLTAIAASGLPAAAIIPRTARTSAIAHNKFMVLVPGGTTPTEVWTGSTNLTDNGFFGQANVGHWVRDKKTAASYLAYWTDLSSDPGGTATDSAAVVAQKNSALYAEIGALTPSPALTAIATGITPIFSPRSGLAPLLLYTQLIAKSTNLACATFPFDVGKEFTSALETNTDTGPLVFFLLDSIDSSGAATGSAPKVTLNAKNNVYEAVGSELTTPLGKWVAEVNARNFGMAVNVVYIHCKFLLHDPLGADPIVVSGSANFSDASTEQNDENMIIVRGDKRVADIYFTEFNRLFTHYYFRYIANKTANDPPTPGSLALLETDAWLDSYGPGSLHSKRAQVYAEMAL
jgi:phosphatidylserine/phosphatidylglycerophosphate/cardiolipin synthase-like enzyme